MSLLKVLRIKNDHFQLFISSFPYFLFPISSFPVPLFITTPYHYIHTYIHKYSGFLVVLISVGLAQACPNYTTKKYFSERQFSYIVRVLTWRMRSSTSSEGSQLVRIVVPCAQTRVTTIETHSRANGAKRCTFREACPTGHRALEPRAKREARSVLCHSLMIDLTFTTQWVRAWPAVRGVVYTMIAFPPMGLH